MENECPFCLGYHYFEYDQARCAERNAATEYIELVDADISNPPEWVQELEMPVIYDRFNPNASWNLPK